LGKHEKTILNIRLLKSCFSQNKQSAFFKFFRSVKELDRKKCLFSVLVVVCTCWYVSNNFITFLFFFSDQIGIFNSPRLNIYSDLKYVIVQVFSLFKKESLLVQLQAHSFYIITQSRNVEIEVDYHFSFPQFLISYFL